MAEQKRPKFKLKTNVPKVVQFRDDTPATGEGKFGPWELWTIEVDGVEHSYFTGSNNVGTDDDPEWIPSKETKAIHAFAPAKGQLVRLTKVETDKTTDGGHAIFEYRVEDAEGCATADAPDPPQDAPTPEPAKKAAAEPQKSSPPVEKPANTESELRALADLRASIMAVADDAVAKHYSIGDGGDTEETYRARVLTVTIQMYRDVNLVGPMPQVRLSDYLPTPPAPEQPKHSGAFGFLKTATELKAAIGKEAYYAILGSFGFEHANEVPAEDREKQKEIYKAWTSYRDEEKADGLPF